MDPRTRGRPSSRVCLLGNNSHYSANTLLAFISVVFSFTQSLSSNVHFLTFVSFRIIAERLPSPTQSSITHRKSKEQGARSINSLQPWPAKKRQCTSSTWALPWAESATDVTIQTSNGHLIMCGTRSQLRYVSAPLFIFSTLSGPTGRRTHKPAPELECFRSDWQVLYS